MYEIVKSKTEVSNAPALRISFLRKCDMNLISILERGARSA